MAGAGSGKTPCLAVTNPRPMGSGETSTAAPKWTSAAALPTTSTIASTAPTSWKCTSSIDALCALASACASRSKVASATSRTAGASEDSSSKLRMAP